LSRLSLLFNDLTPLRICVASDRKSTVVFAVNVAHVRELTQTFKSAGVDARYLHAGTPIAERNALIDGFKAGAFPVLVNCGSCQGLMHLGHLSHFPCIRTALLTEGTDIPNIDCVVVARPTRSRNVFLQMVNRQCIVFPFHYFLKKPTDWPRNEVVF
jgi:ATP-dependent helicase IRC3